MKKLILFICFILPTSIYAIAELRTKTEANATVENTNDDNYVKIERVECLEIEKDNGKVTSGYYDVYKRKNMSGGFYLETAYLQYSPIYKNTLSSYKGVAVSTYKYYAENKYYRFFFSY